MRHGDEFMGDFFFLLNQIFIKTNAIKEMVFVFICCAHELVSLIYRNFFLTVLQAGSPSSGCWWVWFPRRALCLACRVLASSPRPHVAFSLCVGIPVFLFFIKTQVLLDQGPTLMTSFDLN